MGFQTPRASSGCIVGFSDTWIKTFSLPGRCFSPLIWSSFRSGRRASVYKLHTDVGWDPLTIRRGSVDVGLCHNAPPFGRGRDYIHVRVSVDGTHFKFSWRHRPGFACDLVAQAPVGSHRRRGGAYPRGWAASLWRCSARPKAHDPRQAVLAASD